MAALVAVLLLVFASTLAQRRSEAFVERINNGVKMAKEYFGMDSAAMKAADFVMRTFQTHSEPSQSNSEQQSGGGRPAGSAPPLQRDETFGPLRSVVKLFGLEPSQMSAVAVNAIIFVAQMITTFLSGTQTAHKGRTLRSGEPTSWIIERKSPKLQNLLILAKNESLPNILEDYIKDKASEEEMSCIQLLMCKITPFVSKMQAAVFGSIGGQERKEEDSRSSVLYRHLPSRREVESQSAICETKYPSCDLRKP